MPYEKLFEQAVERLTRDVLSREAVEFAAETDDVFGDLLWKAAKAKLGITVTDKVLQSEGHDDECMRVNDEWNDLNLKAIDAVVKIAKARKS